ncbi:hypothetical protein POJ06DRAFT_238940 [Lipomyces tetrasporus]|uniref:Uncharacterized protein n=1 Tax=Lipomyces tetrasporus TaxID=54092 RepID=A0AAD7VRK8_9ASCO|nr:uncharacterized protein POJ06DRAFT_238940 [Lipomyces tetrasporus]KAJ8099026.1 hypothetical protein POJ06DRAFT_238940 [Lipomyces tetrasporus]
MAVGARRVLGVYSPITVSLAPYLGKGQMRWNEAVHTRIDMTANMLGQMKKVKLLGFTGKLASFVQKLRATEIQTSARNWDPETDPGMSVNSPAAGKAEFESTTAEPPMFSDDDSLQGYGPRHLIHSWDKKMERNFPRCNHFGSGKTTFLRAILNELPEIEGELASYGSTFAFCDQSPWLVNSTVQKNIIGPAHSMSIGVTSIRRSDCGWQQGDDTKPVQGSGLKRIAIARSVHAKADIILIDVD